MVEEFQTTSEIESCLSDLDRGENVFLTGSAGTGKTCLIKRFMSRQPDKNIVTVAPTGIAALNAGGQTIHSFFRFPVPIYKMKNFERPQETLYRKIDILIIDEISMVRADLFDWMNKLLQVNGPKRGRPFGGIQVIVVGDLYQLPPVISENEHNLFYRYYKEPYFFNAKSYHTLQFKHHVLTKSFRQSDPDFIGFLSRVREGICTVDDYSYMSNQVQKTVNPNETTILASTNAVVNKINKKKLSEIDSPLTILQANLGGNAQYNLEKYPVPETMELKIGAKVIFITNDQARRWVNGTIGYITEINVDEDYLVIKTDTGRIVEVTRSTFEDVIYTLKSDGETVDIKVKGFMSQFPLKLAWAITIHKSQGLTLENVHLDLKRLPFAHGQLYVALSRCKTLKGLTTSHPLTSKSIIVDPVVKDFCENINKNDFPFEF